MAGASSPRRRGSRNLNEPRFSSALPGRHPREGGDPETSMNRASARLCRDVRCSAMWEREVAAGEGLSCPLFPPAVPLAMTAQFVPAPHDAIRSEEQTSELQSLMRISYAGFCLKKKKTTPIT